MAEIITTVGVDPAEFETVVESDELVCEDGRLGMWIDGVFVEIVTGGDR